MHTIALSTEELLIIKEALNNLAAQEAMAGDDAQYDTVALDEIRKHIYTFLAQIN